MSDQQIPVPADELAGLSDREQVELIERTDNSLDAADSEVPQPSQEPAVNEEG